MYTRMSKLAELGEVSVSRTLSLAPNTPLSFSLTLYLEPLRMCAVVRLVGEPVSPLMAVIVVPPRQVLGLAHAAGVPASPAPLSLVPLSTTTGESVPRPRGAAAPSRPARPAAAQRRAGVAESRTGVPASSSSTVDQAAVVEVGDAVRARDRGGTA